MGLDRYGYCRVPASARAGSPIKTFRAFSPRGSHIQPTATNEEEQKTVAIVGAGVAGLSAACALAESGIKVHLIERRGYLGGRASSYLHPGVNEVIDNCQHVLFGCCTNLAGFYQRVGVEKNIHWTSEMTMIEPGGRRSVLGPSLLPAPLHGLPRLLTAHAFTLADKLALARAFSAILRFNPKVSPAEPLSAWLERHGQTPGAVNRFWRLVIASALNAELDSIAVPYAAKVVRELFMNSAWAGAMGMSTVPLTELYAGAENFLRQNGAEIHFNTNVECAAWDEEVSEWTLTTRTGPLIADYLILALPFEATAKLIPNMPAAEGAAALLGQVEQHQHWPICSVHLWFDREITELDHAVLLDREIHWMYNKSKLQPWRKTKRQLYRAGGQQLAGLRSAGTQPGHHPGHSRASGVFPRRGLCASRKSRSGERGSRHVRSATGDRQIPAGRRGLALAQQLFSRRLDRNRLALHHGKRRAQRPPGCASALCRGRRAAQSPPAGSEAEGIDEAFRARSWALPFNAPADTRPRTPAPPPPSADDRHSL